MYLKELEAACHGVEGNAGNGSGAAWKNKASGIKTKPFKFLEPLEFLFILIKQHKY